MPYLDITSGQGTRRLALAQNPVTIGRSSTNVVPLEDNLTSRAHCVIEKRVEGYRLRDLDSSNGTYCNSERIETVLLKEGDEFQVGAVRFVFHGGDLPTNAPGSS